MVKNIIENNLLRTRVEMEFFMKEKNKESHDFFKRI